MWGGKRGCPKFDYVAARLEELKAKSAGNPAYAEGFTAALSHKEFKQYGINYGNGFQNFSGAVAGALDQPRGSTRMRRWTDSSVRSGAGVQCRDP